MTEREALKLARQLLWRYRHETPMGDQPHMICQEVDEAFERIDEALAQPEQEPVAWRFRSGTWFNREAHWRYINTLEGAEGLRGLEPLYTTPPKRTWVGLTDEERKNIFLKWYGRAYTDQVQSVMNSVEAKLKEKNT